MTDVEALERDLAAHASRGRTPTLGGEAALSTEVPGLSGEAVARGSSFWTHNGDSLVLAPFRCGDEDGLLLAVLTGNFKDEGCCVATSAAALALLDAFSAPLLAEADLVPTLRRAVIDAHERIRILSEGPLGRLELHSVMGARDSLRGIAASLTAVAVRRHRLHGIHVGEGRAFLVRNGRAKKLNVAHTLGRLAEYRERVRSGEISPIDFAGQVVIKVLGLSDPQPSADVFRVDLQAGDRIVVGNLALSDELMADHVTAEPSGLAEAMLESFQSAPATVGVVRLA